MRLLSYLLVAVATVTSAVASKIPHGAHIAQPHWYEGPHSKGYDNGKKDKWGNCVENDRRAITIRSSNNDTDDVSADFVWALNQANNGGLVHLEAGKTYMIGKKVDLPVLNDVYIKLDGTLKARWVVGLTRAQY